MGPRGSKLCHPKDELKTGTEPQVGLLCPLLPSTAPFLLAERTVGTAVVVHLGRTSDDSDTSFPPWVSIFLMATILEELVLVQLKDPQASPELTLAWKPRLSLRFQ